MTVLPARPIRHYPLEVGTVVLAPECSDCGTPIPRVALITSDASDFYCFACVARYYEAMKAALTRR
jgi:hypothetical protein